MRGSWGEEKGKGHETAWDVRICDCLPAGTTHHSHSCMNHVVVSQFTFLPFTALSHLLESRELRFFRKDGSSGLQEGISLSLQYCPPPAPAQPLRASTLWLEEEQEETGKSWGEESIIKATRFSAFTRSLFKSHRWPLSQKTAVYLAVFYTHITYVHVVPLVPLAAIMKQ